jgi:hypothetical protein
MQIIQCPRCGNDVNYPDVIEAVPGNRMREEVKCPWERCDQKWIESTSAVFLTAFKHGEDRRQQNTV